MIEERHNGIGEVDWAAIGCAALKVDREGAGLQRFGKMGLQLENVGLESLGVAELARIELKIAPGIIDAEFRNPAEIVSLLEENHRFGRGHVAGCDMQEVGNIGEEIAGPLTGHHFGVFAQLLGGSMLNEKNPRHTN